LISEILDCGKVVPLKEQFSFLCASII
jgi:hypothetical protein